ncbi:hypothetical protein PCE1_003969 [Barthelona sp. PCE]
MPPDPPSGTWIRNGYKIRVTREKISEEGVQELKEPRTPIINEANEDEDNTPTTFEIPPEGDNNGNTKSKEKKESTDDKSTVAKHGDIRHKDAHTSLEQDIKMFKKHAKVLKLDMKAQRDDIYECAVGVCDEILESQKKIAETIKHHNEKILLKSVEKSHQKLEQKMNVLEKEIQKVGEKNESVKSDIQGVSQKMDEQHLETKQLADENIQVQRHIAQENRRVEINIQPQEIDDIIPPRRTEVEEYGYDRELSQPYLKPRDNMNKIGVFVNGLVNATHDSETNWIVEAWPGKCEDTYIAQQGLDLKDDKNWFIDDSEHFLRHDGQRQILRQILVELEINNPTAVCKRITEVSVENWMHEELAQKVKEQYLRRDPKTFDDAVADEAFDTIAPFVEKVEEDQIDEIAVVNDVFAIPKDNGDVRVIMNAPEAHDASLMLPVALPGERIMKLIPPRAYMASIDLSSWFYHNKMEDELSNYFAFKHKGDYYRFKKTPFGSSIAGNISISVSKMIASIVNKYGGCVEVYVDDFLIYHNDIEMVRRTVRAIKALCFLLGIKINREKSIVEPTKIIDWLGFEFDTSDLLTTKVRIAKKKSDAMVIAIKEHLDNLYSEDGVTLLQAKSLAGKLASKSFACPRLKRHADQIEEIIRDSTRKILNINISQDTVPLFTSKGLGSRLIPESLIDDYKLAIRAAKELLKENKQRRINACANDVIIATDACLNEKVEGRGGFAFKREKLRNELNRSVEDPGTLMRDLDLQICKESHHIMEAEVVALYSMFSKLAEKNPDSDFLLCNDNSAVVYGLRAGKSKNKELNEVIRMIFEKADEFNIRINIMYVQTKLNIAADYLSRGIAIGEREKMYQIKSMLPAKTIKLRPTVPPTVSIPVMHAPFYKQTHQSSKGQSGLMFHMGAFYGRADSTAEPMLLPEYSQTENAYVLTEQPSLKGTLDSDLQVLLDDLAPKITATTFDGEQVELPVMSKIESATQDLPHSYLSIRHEGQNSRVFALNVALDTAIEVLVTKAIQHDVIIEVLLPSKVPFTSLWSRVEHSILDDGSIKMIIDPKKLTISKPPATPVKEKVNRGPLLMHSDAVMDTLKKMYDLKTRRSMINMFNEIRDYIKKKTGIHGCNELMVECTEFKHWNDWFFHKYGEKGVEVASRKRSTHRSYFSRMRILFDAFLYTYPQFSQKLTDEQKQAIGRRCITYYHSTIRDKDTKYKMAATADIVKLVMVELITSTKTELETVPRESRRSIFLMLLTQLAYMALAYLTAARTMDLKDMRFNEVKVLNKKEFSVVFRNTKTNRDNKMWNIPIEDISNTPGLDWLVAYLCWAEQQLEDGMTIFKAHKIDPHTGNMTYDESHPGVKYDKMVIKISGAMKKVQQHLVDIGVLPYDADTYARLTPHSLRSGYIVDQNMSVDDSSIHGRWSKQANSAHEYYLTNVKPSFEEPEIRQRIDSSEIEYESFYAWLYGLPNSEEGSPYAAPYPNLDLCKESDYFPLLPVNMDETLEENHGPDQDDPVIDFEQRME